MIRVVLALCFIFFAHVAESYSSDSELKRNIDTAGSVRRISGSWYDTSSGQYRPPVIAPPLDDAIRSQGWVAPEVKNTWWKWLTNWNLGTGGATTGSWGLSAEGVAYLIWGLLGALLLTGLCFLIYHYLGDHFGWNSKAKRGPGKLTIDPAKVSELPFDMEMTRSDPLGEAEARMRDGRYREAVIYLYSYMLLALDQTRVIHLQKGRTNRMYLRELRADRQLSDILYQTMLAFEDVYFGRHDIDRNRVEKLFDSVEAFHQRLAAIGSSLKPAHPEVATV